MVPCSVIRRRRSQVDKARHIRHYVEHLADIAVLGGNRGQLDGAAAGGVVRHEPERIERRGVVFSLLPSSRAAAPAVLAACRDCRLPAPRPAAAPQLAPTNSSAEGATAAAPAGRGVGDRREEEGRGGGGGTRAGAAVRHGGPRQPVCVPNSLRWWTGGALVAAWLVLRWFGGRIPARRIIVVVAAKKLGSEAIGRAGLASSHVARGLEWGCSVR